MKFFAPAPLLAFAAFSLFVVVPFLPGSHKVPDEFALEARLSSSVEGNVQVYYDFGNGLREADSIALPLAKSETPRLYRLPLRPGRYHGLRFDPIDRDGTVTIEDPRIVDAKGRTLRKLPLSDFRAANQIRSLQEKDGRLEVVVVPGGSDPQLTLSFATPLKLEMPWSAFAADWLRRAAMVFVFLAIAGLALDRSAGLRRRLAAAGRWTAARPGRAIIIVAAVAVVASAYPVVFLGKSYVSPNYGTTLLYDGYPTLPGDQNDRMTDVQGSDVGSMMWQFVPFSVEQHRAIFRDGELPLWDRYNSCGTPLLGQGYSMIGDPLHLIPVLADGAAWAWDLKYLVAKWLFAAALGLIVLAVTRHLPASLIVALAAPFAGFFIYRFNHPAFFSFCYGPWPLYCWIRATQTGRARAVAGWCALLILANLALINSGSAKESYMLLLTMNFSGACVLLASAAPWRVRLAKLAGFAWAAVLFLLLSAPVWFTFAETLRSAFTAYNEPHAYQLQPGIMLGAFDEAFYRLLTADERVFNPSANFLILAGLLYFLATLRQHFSNRAVMALAASALIPLSFAFGLVPPAWIEHTPFLGNVAHIDNSFCCPLILLWSVLAGAGFAMAARRLGTREGRGDLLIAGLFLFALVFAFIAFRQAVLRPTWGPADATYSPLQVGQTIPVSRFVWGYLALLLAALIGIGWIARRALARRALTPAAAILLSLCTIALLWREGQQAESSGFESYIVRPAPRPNLLARSRAVGFVHHAQSIEPSRSIGMQNNMLPGWSGVYGLEGVSGPDPLASPDYRAMTGLSPLQELWNWRIYLLRDYLAASRPFLDFLNVRYYFDLRSDQGALGAILKLDRLEDLDVYESRTTWPRAFFTDRVAVYRQPEDLMRRILHGDGRPFAAMQASDLPAYPGLARFSRDLGGRIVAPADHYRLTENSTSFEIRSPGPGVVVLNEAWWPGYPHAKVDGREAKVLRLNHTFEGLIIGAAGTHEVTVRYWPRHFNLLLALSALSLVLMAGTFAAIFRIEKKA